MKLEIAEAIFNAAGEISADIEIRECYVGRGSCGTETTGLVYDSENDLFMAIAIAAVNINEKQGHIDDLLNALRCLRRDNMGRSMIVS